MTTPHQPSDLQKPTLPNSSPNSGEGCDLVWTEVAGLTVPQALPKGTMLMLLHDLEKALPKLLEDSSQWKSLDIDHCVPRVERVLCKFNELTVDLHCIHPCEPDKALFHPHPWPSAVRILSGRYEMGTGYGSGGEHDRPAISRREIYTPGSEYEMVDPNDWHYVAPLDGPCFSLMLTSKKWDRTAPKNSRPLAPLSDARKEGLLNFFRSLIVPKAD